MGNALSERPVAKDVAPALDFDLVYREHFGYVFRLVARLAGAAEAEDLTQDVFVVVHRRLAGFEGRSQLRTWLFQIAYRVVGASIRKQRLRRLLALRLHTQPVEASSSTLQSIERAQETEEVARALARLSWDKRAVLVLHELEGWPCALIAERLEVPTNTVYTRLHHARRELAAAIRKVRLREERRS